jgi:hypothetical protein
VVTTKQPGPMTAILTCVAVFAFSIACDRKPSEANSNPAPAERPAAVETAAGQAPPTAPAAASAESAPTGPSGTLTTEPNPVVVCEKTGLGTATISWAATGTKVVEVRVGAPDGKLFTNARATGSVKTGDWVKKGTVFYLQNVENGAPLTPANTLARLEVDVVNGPCK